MSNVPVNIYFDCEGKYSTTDGDEWIRREGVGLYGVSFKTLGEITYSLLVHRISKKMKLDESCSLRLSFFPLVVYSRTPSFIFDDEDVHLYLTSLDKEQRRSVLLVEVIKNMEVISFHLARAEIRSSYGMNYEDGVVNVYANEGQARQPHEQIENCIIEDGENLSGIAGARCDVDNNNDVENIIDNDVDNNVDNDRSEYVELPHAVPVQQSQFVNPWEDGLGLELKQEFEKKETVVNLVERGKHQNCFRVHVAQSDTKRYVVKCREFRKGCKWHLRVVRLPNSAFFQVRVYNKFHTCSRASASTSSGRRGTKRLVASVLNDDYSGELQTPKPKQLISLVQGRYGVEVCYSTAWRGKNQAVSDIRGSPEDSYRMLYPYLHMLKKVNPGTKTSVVLDEEKRFRYLFVALGACIEGFYAMRKVIIVDATFLTTTYGGVLIFATCQDPNLHHYPIAFAVVDGEKDDSWRWFFNTLKTIIPDNPELVFISDRNASLIKAVAEVYPTSHHGYCTFHLSQNVKAKVSPARKKDAAEKFRNISQIYTAIEFEQQFADFKGRYPAIDKYLAKSVDVAKWARCYFPGERYNINTTNSAESMNSVFKNNARKHSLLPMMDLIIEKWSEWFNTHRNDSVSGSNVQKLVPYVENILHARFAVACKLSVVELNTTWLEYSVNEGKSYLVNLRNKTCSCKCFDIDRYPCVHAIAAMIKYLNRERSGTDISDFYELCSPYYLIEQWALAYCRTIYPVPDVSEWVIPEEIQGLYALPPEYTKNRGRNQENRFKPPGERRAKNRSVPGRDLGVWFESGAGSQE